MLSVTPNCSIFDTVKYFTANKGTHKRFCQFATYIVKQRLISTVCRQTTTKFTFEQAVFTIAGTEVTLLAKRNPVILRQGVFMVWRATYSRTLTASNF